MIRFFSVFILMCGPLFAGGEGEKFFKDTPEENFQRSVIMRLHETCVYPEEHAPFVVPKGLKVTEQNNLAFDEECSPSQALISFLMPQETGEPWKIDCTIAMLVSNVLYALKLIEEEDFNSYITDFALNKELHWSPHCELTSPVNNPILKADRENIIGYIKNLEGYETIFLGSAGIYRGINVITCGANEMGEMTYLGFEPIFGSGPKTKLEIYDVLAFHLCYDSIPNGLFGAIRTRIQIHYQEIWEKDKDVFFSLLDEAQSEDEKLKFSYELKAPEEKMEN